MIFMFILCGCNPAKDIFVSRDGLRADGRVEYGGEIYEMELISGLFGTFSATVISKPLEGFTYKKTVDSEMLIYKGIDYKGVPPNSVFTLLADVFEAACKSSVPLRECGKGEYILEGGSKSGDYTFVFDENGRPLRLNLPSHKLVTVFHTFE